MAFGDRIQGTSKDGGSTTSSSLAFNNPVASGNTVVVVIRRGGLTGTISVTDDKSNSYTQDATKVQTSDGHQLFIFHCSNITNAPQTVTVSFQNAFTMRWCQEEYVGNFALHGTPPVAEGSGVSPSSGDQVTTATCAIIGAQSNSNSGGNVFTPGTGYILRDAVPPNPGSNHIVDAEDKNGAQVAGTHRADGTLSASESWAMIMVAYSDASGAGTTPITITTQADSLAEEELL
jgi:hypothetical protein